MKKIIFIFLFCLLYLGDAFGQFTEAQAGVPSLQELTDLDHDILRLEQHNKDTTSALKTLEQEMPLSEVTKNDLSRVRVELEQVQATITTLIDQITIVDKNIEETQKRNNALSSQLQKQSNPLITGADADELLQSRAQTEQLLHRNQEQFELLQQKRKAIEQSIGLAEKRKTILEGRYQRYNEYFIEKSNTPPPSNEGKREKLAELENMRTRLTKDLGDNLLSREKRLDKNIEISLINKQIFYTETENELLILESRLQELQYADLATLSLDRINRIRTELDVGKNRIETLQSQLINHQKLITEQYSLYLRQRNNPPSNIIIRHANMNEQYDDLKNLLENNLINLNMNSEIADRQYNQLAQDFLTTQYRPTEAILQLPKLSLQLLKSNSMFIGQYAVALQTLYHGLLKLSSNLWITLTIAGGLLVLITTVITSFLNRLIKRYSEQKLLGFSSRLLYFISVMLKSNLPYITFFILMIAAIHITNIAAPASGLLILIPAIVLLNTIPYCAANSLIKINLIATPVRTRIIRPTVILAALGSFLFALVMMAQWILDNAEIIDAYRWIFAVYNLLIALPLWRTINRTLYYMNEYYSGHFTYRILRPVIYAMVLSILIFGSIGTFGFLNLAWTLAHYLLIFFLYALCWVGILALLKDTSLRAKHYAVRNTSNGVFWAQDVINPIHSLCRYSSLFILVYFLLKQFNWDSTTPVIREMLIVINKPITGTENGQFTLRNILFLAVIVYIIYRIGGWLKSFSYRWVFSNIQDLGIRNSLSVFSQYAIVTLGFFLALRIVGLDLTTFAVFAGALGVGIGFGMQNIAHNFISGILLLIERPLRNGDIITVGNYIGTVERIGMRSLTISTFDNENVILPNSDFVTSAFMNWSHTDQIIRTVFYLDLSYRHDPKTVEALFNAAMKELVEEKLIIHMPEPDYLYGAFAYDYSERGIRYRIQYYIDMIDQQLLVSRHSVVQKIWQVCRDNGLEIAYPKQDIYFPDNPDQLSHHIQKFNSHLMGKMPPT